MMWTFTTDIESYALAAEPWLLRDPVRNTVPLTVLLNLRRGQFAENPLLGWLSEGGPVLGAVTHTPPWPLLLGVVPLGSLPDLARDLITVGREIPGVSAPLDVADTFARAWWEPERSRRSERLYRLASLVAPEMPGRARTAVSADLPMVVTWMRDFQTEANVDVTADPAPVASARVNRNEIILWEDQGQAVALAAASMPIAGMSRVGPVYTPPRFRQRGYGSAVTHAITEKARKDGATEVLLFTDLSNPTSNSIYLRLGYHPVGDYASIHFRTF